MSEPRPSLRDLEHLDTPDLWPEIVHRADRLGHAPAPVPVGVGRLAGSRLVLAVLGSATALAVAAVLITTPFGGGGTAQAILEAARLRFADTPPFDAEILLRIDASSLIEERPEYPGGDDVIRRRVRYAGPERWRRDTLEETQPPVMDGGAGSNWVWDGVALGVYRAHEDVFFVQPTAGSFDPLGELGWAGMTEDACGSGARLLADEPVAGRLTHHIECMDRSVWVDPESGLIMRHTAPGFASEVVSVTYDPVLDADAFRVEAPAGAGDGLEGPPATTLEVGAEPPAWGGQLLDGEPLSLDDLRGSRAALYLWADWCDKACLDDLPAVAALAATSPGDLRVVTVAVQSESTGVEAALEALGLSLPVVIDDGAIHEAWGIDAVPVLIVLDADGVVRQVAIGRDIDAVLEDLRAGG